MLDWRPPQPVHRKDSPGGVSHSDGEHLRRLPPGTGLGGHGVRRCQRERLCLPRPEGARPGGDRQLAYQPNLLARSLAKQKSHMLGMVVPDIANPFWPEVVSGAEDRAHTAGYTLLLANTDDDQTQGGALSRPLSLEAGRRHAVHQGARKAEPAGARSPRAVAHADRAGVTRSSPGSRPTPC